MTKFDRRRSRPAPRLLFALLMAGGLVLGGFAAPALAAETGTATEAVTQAQSTTDQATDTSVVSTNVKAAQLSSAAGTMPQAKLMSAAVCLPGQSPETDDCVVEVPCDVDGLPIGCTPPPAECPDGDTDPEQAGCQPAQGDCDGVDFNGPDVSGCGEPPPLCQPEDYNGDQPGCGTAPKPPKTPKPHRPHKGNHPGTGSSGPSGTSGHQGNPTTIGSSTGAPEGILPGVTPAQVSSPVSCDPVICAASGVPAQSSPPAAASTQAATSGGATTGAAQTLPDTGAPVHSTLLALLGFGLVGGGVVLVRRPRGRHRLARG